ncbi:MAG TPA: hypothetical protein VFE68_14230, partial [Vicinamibacteria bacterium]|nr:hypothetical protein [Vicinamibacteria bacterium]
MSDIPDEDPPAERELPSDFLRGQFRQWMDAAVAAGKTRDLFELEMWLRSFERFFRIKNQPLSEKETKQLALRNWSEELRLVDNVILRTVQLCTSILTEDQVNLARFDKYVESYLKKDDVVDPYIEKLVRQSTPESGLSLLREALEDLHTILMDLTRLSRIPYGSFTAVGKTLHREIRRSHILAMLIDKKFKPVHDRITSPALATTIRAIVEPTERKHAARVFLELFRLLHYLDYADPAHTDEDQLKNTILIFSLTTSETRLLLTYLERRVLKALSPDSPAFALYDSFVYCLPFELKKVINTELLDISVTRQPDIVRARVENSHGILKDCFQQSVVQLAQAFDAKVEGRDIFPDFTAKLEQSVGLRDSLARLIRAVRQFQATRDEYLAVAMKEEISVFYDHNMKDLMYRDWSGFELFFIEILKCS